MHRKKIRKKANGLAIGFFVMIIIIVIFWLIGISARECNSDSACKEDYYCGSDFKCHQMKIVEKTVVKNDYITPSIIVGISIIIAAIILRHAGLKSIAKKIAEYIKNFDLIDKNTPKHYTGYHGFEHEQERK